MAIIYTLHHPRPWNPAHSQPYSSTSQFPSFLHTHIHKPLFFPASRFNTRRSPSLRPLESYSPSHHQKPIIVFLHNISPHVPTANPQPTKPPFPKKKDAFPIRYFARTAPAFIGPSTANVHHASWVESGAEWGVLLYREIFGSRGRGGGRRGVLSWFTRWVVEGRALYLARGYTKRNPIPRTGIGAEIEVFGRAMGVFDPLALLRIFKKGFQLFF